jgi:hypothetical protein
MAKGIIFQPQASNPIPNGNNGIWVNNSNEVIFVNQSNVQTNIIALLNGGLSAAATGIPLKNNTGSTITKGTPVSINSSGELQLVDVTVDANALAAVGVAATDIPNASSGTIIMNGIITNITTGLAFGSAVFITPAGTLTSTYPSIGNGDGFAAGDFIIKVGVIAKNATTPANKDLLVNLYVVGQL